VRLWAGDHSLLQFGKMGKHWYALDVRFPMSPVQALATAITSFEAGTLVT
jgi:hypothetical protein